MPETEQLHRAAGAIALTVGVATALAPKPFLRPFGVAARDVTGVAELGWRLFGIRTALVGGAAIRGDAGARAAILPVQIADQLVFAQLARSGGLPRRATALAQAVSGALIALELLAHRGT